jgi:hypothetical protein
MGVLGIPINSRIVYEINIAYDGDSDSDVLEIGIIKIDTTRVKKDFS